MANVVPQISHLLKIPHVHIYLWEGIGSNIVGDPVSQPNYRNVTIQALGNFSAQTLTLQGSLDGVTYVTLKDNAGTDITFTAAGMLQLPLGIIPPYIRPSMSTGGTPDVDLLMCMTSPPS